MTNRCYAVPMPVLACPRLHDAFRCFTHPPQNLSNQGQSIASCHISTLFRYCAMPVTSQPRRWYSLQCYAVAMYFLTELFHCTAIPRATTASRRPAYLRHANANRCIAMPSPIYAQLNYSLASYCHANPLQRTSELCLSVAMLCKTMPLRY